jgi:hypothetical protein
VENDPGLFKGNIRKTTWKVEEIHKYCVRICGDPSEIRKQFCVRIQTLNILVFLEFSRAE